MKFLPLLALVLSAALGTVNSADLPEEVIVQTDPTPAAKFAPWKPADVAAYAGTYAGDVSGDTNGKLTVKITKSGKETVQYTASGKYLHNTAGLESAVVTFTNAIFDASDEKFATAAAGPVAITFVTLDGTNGVVIGGSFIPKS